MNRAQIDLLEFLAEAVRLASPPDVQREIERLLRACDEQRQFGPSHKEAQRGD